MARSKFSPYFAAVLRKHRQRAGLSQEALAENADIHRTFMGMLERGERSPTIDTASKLAEALDVPLDILIAEARAEWVKDVGIKPSLKPAKPRRPKSG